MEAFAEEGGVELRDRLPVLDQTGKVEGGELHAFKGDPVELIDGVLEDEKEAYGVRALKFEDTEDRDLDGASDETFLFTTIPSLSDTFP